MKSQICEICGKHAEVEPLGCKHYPNKSNILVKSQSLMELIHNLQDTCTKLLKSKWSIRK